MDFFQHQDVARKKTSVLVFYFLVAVALIVAAVYLAVVAVLMTTQGQGELWDPRLFVLVTLCTTLVIATGSLYKMSQLRGGGATVARMLGGRQIRPNTQDLDERVLLNVVEEMAIAAGMAVPPVYLLEDESGINAFAAGFTPTDAVIGVTRGTLETLTRDELQGVIAHEFSHILNGDMRLNVRLIGVLHGILLIALIGYGILRTFRHVRGSRSKKGGGAIVAVLLLGVAFLIVGYVGLFFGKLIKSAVSRQREFLADASAVQFTRNPGGISGALKKIGGAPSGSRVKDESAQETSHLFFGNALRTGFLGLLSTHPPLPERIRRIEPQFDGRFPRVERVPRTARDLHREDLARASERQAGASGARASSTKTEAHEAVLQFQPAAAVASVGTVDPAGVERVAGLIAALPEHVVESAHEPLGAVATVYCLLLDADADIRGRQLEGLREHADHGVVHELERILPLMAHIGPEARLPLVEMTIPALRQMSDGQYRAFRVALERLVEADLKVSLFEHALQRMLMRHLAPRFEKLQHRRPRIRFNTLRPLLSECSCLLSALAHAGQRNGSEPAHAFARGAATLARAADELTLLPHESCGSKELDRALGRLASAAPQIKKRVLEAAAACIDSDGTVAVEEAELLRLVADSLDCPMPPLLAGQGA